MRDHLREEVETSDFIDHCVDLASTARVHFEEMDLATFSYVFTGDQESLKNRLRVDDVADRSFELLRDALMHLPNSEAMVEAWHRAQDQDDQVCSPVEDNMLDLVAKGHPKEAQLLYKEKFSGALDKYTSLQNDLANMLKEYNSRHATASAARARDALSLGWVIQIGLIVGCILVALWLARSMSTRLRTMEDVATSLANGEPRQDLDLTEQDEIGRVAAAFAKVIDYQAKLAVVATAIAGGDLTQTVIPKSDKDVLGIAFQNMLSHLRDLIGEVARSATGVSETSRSLAAASEQSGTSASEIAEASEKLASGATDASAVMQQLMAAIQTVATGSNTQTQSLQDAMASLAEATEGVKTVSAAAQSMSLTANAGSDAVQRTVGAMRRVQSQVEHSTGQVRQLDLKSQEIGAIVRTIETIAEQTNLLALNAAIEAARAGQNGRGFAVVADEVRKLAEKAALATKDISLLIHGVRATVEQTVRAIEATGAEVEEGSATSQEAGAALAQIVLSAEAVASRAENVFDLTGSVNKVMAQVSLAAQESQCASEEMSLGADKLADSIITVAAVGEETAAGAEELRTSVRDVNGAAVELSGMSNTLQELVHRFIVIAPKSDKEVVAIRLAA